MANETVRVASVLRALQKERESAGNDARFSSSKEWASYDYGLRMAYDIVEDLARRQKGKRRGK